MWLYATVQSYGLAGAFIVSIIGNLILFVPLPYIFAVFWLSSVVDPLALGVVSGLGAAIGKLVVYYIGYSSRRVLSDEVKRKLEFARKIMERYGEFAIFLLAVTPSPDDMLYLPLGMISYSPIKFFIFCLLGKTAMTLIVTYGGHYSIGAIAGLFSTQGDAVSILITVVFVVGSVYATVKVDWEKLFVKYLAKKDEAFKDLAEEEK